MPAAVCELTTSEITRQITRPVRAPKTHCESCSSPYCTKTDPFSSDQDTGHNGCNQRWRWPWRRWRRVSILHHRSTSTTTQERRGRHFRELDVSEAAWQHFNISSVWTTYINNCNAELKLQLILQQVRHS